MAAKDPRDLKLSVAGCCRDVAKYLDKVFANIHRIGSLFQSYQVFVVESDSNDNTLAILLDYQAKSLNGNKVTVLSLGNLSQQHCQRTERLAICRNAILDYTWSQRDGGCQPDYLLMMDFDNVTAGDINLDGVKSNFTRTDWTVVTPGNPQCYYDIWALRWPGRLDYDFNQGIDEDVASGMSGHQAYQKGVSWNYKCTTQPGQDWISVESAFGGAAFYDLAKLRPDYRYSSWIEYHHTGVNETTSQFVVGKRRYRCEHVGLHESIIKDGGKIYINPNFVLPLN